MNGLNKILSGLLLLQVVVLLGMRVGSEDSLRVRSLTVLEGYDAAEVEQIAIWGAPKEGSGPSQESVVLEKTNGKWTIGGTDGYPADEAKVEELLETLGTLRSRTVVVESDVYHDKLEVSPEKYQRKVTVTQGGKPTTFFVGSSPSFKNVHVRLDGSDQVLLVNEFGASQLGSRAWHWVDRKYQDIPEDQVWAVKIDNAKGTVQLEKDPASKSWAALGITEDLVKSTVDDLVRKARTINMESPVGKTVAPEHGLDSPLATVTLTTGTSTVAGAPPPTTETVTVRIGKKDEAKNQYFVKSSKSDYVVRVAGWAVSPLVEKGREDLVEKKD